MLGPAKLKPKVLPPRNTGGLDKRGGRNSGSKAGAKPSGRPTKSSRRKKNKHNSIVPDIIEERHKGSDKVRTYTKGKYLGKGGFARCYLLTCRGTGRIYAGKVVSKSSLTKEKAQQKLVAEIKIHQHLHHKHIVQFFHSFQDKHNVYILLELCSNQSLMELVKRRKKLTEPETRYYMLQIISAVEYLHNSNVIHRDLKLGNLFLNSRLEVKLGDMGLSAKLNHSAERKKTICGTPNYIAPEIISGGTHSFEVDIWSIGVILFTMLIGKPPFETRDVKATYKRICAGKYEIPDSADISRHARDLIQSLLQLQPASRPNLSKIKRHPFFTSVNAFIPDSLPATTLTEAPNFTSAAKPRRPGVPKPKFGMESLKTAGLEAKRLKSAPARSPLGRVDMNEHVSATAHVDAQHNRRDRERPSSAAARTGKAASDVVRSTRPTTAHASSKHHSKKADGHDLQADRLAAVTRRMKALELRAQEYRNVAWGSNDGARNSTTVGSTSGMCDSNARATSLRSGVTAGAPIELKENMRKRSGDVGRKSREAPMMLSTLKTMHRELTKSLTAVDANLLKRKDCQPEVTDAASNEDLRITPPKVWVVRHVDYTRKYGFGYMLSDGSVGVYFNDSTKIILATDGIHFEYIERMRCSSRTKQPVRHAHTLTSYPESLKKKVTLLIYFKAHLCGESPESCAAPTAEVSSKSDADTEAIPLTYVKKWVRTNRCLLFRLSDRSVQVLFFDGTEIVLSQHEAIITLTYCNKKKVRTSHSLDAVMRSRKSDILKRLRYTKMVIHELLSGGISSSKKGSHSSKHRASKS